MNETKRVDGTSHAHSVDPVKDGKLADSSKTLNAHFAKAKAAQLEKQNAAKQPSTNMSHAKTVQMDTKENKLDAASRNVNTQFARAKAAQLAPKTAQPTERPGSQMVQNDKPILRPVPRGPMREGPDRQSYNDRLAADRQKAQTLNESIKSRQNGQKSIESTHGRDKNNDDRSR